MLSKLFRLSPVILLVALASGCGSGGGSSNPSAGDCASPVSSFCLVACNLGCSRVGCAVTEIAPNQAIQLNFSRTVDPASVNKATVSIKTPTGQTPSGQLMVSGSTVTFVPDVKLISGMTTFGFKPNETYVMTLPGGPNQSQAVRGSSGGSLATTITCNLTVSRPPIDPNNRPPAGVLLAPTQTSDVDREVTIVVEFDEVIDVSGFQGATTATTPVLFRLRPTISNNGVLQCDPNALAQPLPGVPRAFVDPASNKTQIVLKPSIVLPRAICVEVEITERVTDLAGIPATPRTFTFTTLDLGPEPKQIVETFTSSLQLDLTSSSGRWGNGEAVPGLIGGDGSLGAFDIRDGVETSPGSRVWEWNTDNQLIPGKNTISGQPITVTDGVFRFSSFELPAGDTLVFKGAVPPRFVVRGSARIDGIIQLNAPDLQPHQRTLATGQPGGLGAVFGGRGGNGADAGNGLGNQPNFNGQPGETVQLMAGHAYGTGGSGGDRVTGTGGLGSPQYPADGLESSITFNGLGFLSGGVITGHFFCQQVAAGGGGGGFFVDGGLGRAVRSCSGGMGPFCDTEFGDQGVGGHAFDLFPIPAGASILDHFLVGGSGGGGGGSHPFWSTLGQAVPPQQTHWYSGAAGGGGGGAIAFRVGGDFTMSPGSAIAVKGGSAANNASPPPAPGGGGSGGSCVLQVGRTANLNGIVDASGGKGGFTDDNSIINVETRGGDGAPGFVRLEIPTTATPAALGTTIPPATTNSIGLLTETDQVVGSQSLFYVTGEVFPPVFRRYELQVTDTVTNANAIFSDDPTWTSPFGPNLGAATLGAPVRLLFQGGQADLTTQQVDPITLGPWRDSVWIPGASLNTDQVTAFRFQLLFDRAINPNVVVKRLIVYYDA